MSQRRIAQALDELAWYQYIRKCLHFFEATAVQLALVKPIDDLAINVLKDKLDSAMNR